MNEGPGVNAEVAGATPSGAALSPMARLLVRTHRASRTVTVPSGARSMVVRWRYAGGNDWYWAVDDPRVTTTR